jgi:DNA-binding NtrC family response regulator
MDAKSGNILIVDDDVDVLQAARLLLKQQFEHVKSEKNPDKIPSLMSDMEYDVILLDMNFTRDVSSGQEGFYWLGKILDIDPMVVVILTTAYGDVAMAVKAIKAGATDFVLKPWQNEKLLATISAGIELRQMRREILSLKSKGKQLAEDIDQKFRNFIGNSPAIQKVFETIEKIAATDANILILGENGTGKELAAREIHRQSSRFEEDFISVDIGSITETLFESELFGHTKGAFTDAKESRTGRFEMATGGTLFLDEIGNLNTSLQAKLLKVLNDRTITRVGSNKEIPIDIRLICATNTPINDMVADNRFRQDLLYRINTVEIKMPPLRDRAGDIPLLVDHYLKFFCRKYQKNINKVPATIIKRLESYHWPGNVRELRHAVERAVIMSEAGTFMARDFLQVNSKSRKAGVAVDSYNLGEVEETVIRKALIKHNGNVSQTAGELGLTRASLYRRIRKYGL